MSERVRRDETDDDDTDVPRYAPPIRPREEVAMPAESGVVVSPKGLNGVDAWVEPSPYYPGSGDWRIRGHGIAVWTLIAYLTGMYGRDVTDQDVIDRAAIEQVATDYGLEYGAVKAAWEYYRNNRDAINARIAANAL